MIGAALGYRVELVIPANAGEKRRIAETFGANVVLSDAMMGRMGRLLKPRPGSRLTLNAISCRINTITRTTRKAHYDTNSAMEIWKQTGGQITHFVAGIGTSGTLMGTARRLKELNPKIQISP